MVYMEVDTKIQKTINCKPTEQLTHLHRKSEHPQPLQVSIPCMRSSASESNLFNAN